MDHRLARPRLLTGLVLLLMAAALLLVPAPQASATFPTKCAAGGVKVTPKASPATVTATDTTTNTGIPVVVTITGTSLTIAPTGTGVTLETASWCLKAQNTARVHNGTGTSGVSPFTNNNGVVKKIAHLVVYTVTTTFTDPVGSCWDNTLAGTNIVDTKYVGPINTLNNTTAYDSGDGTCTGIVRGLATVVQASDASTARALCIPLGYRDVAFNLNAFGYLAAPADFWECRR